MYYRLLKNLQELGLTEYNICNDFIKIFYYGNVNCCNVVIAVNYMNPQESGITFESLYDINEEIKQYLGNKSVMQIEILNIICTYSEYLAEDITCNKLNYWVIDTYHNKLVVPQGQNIVMDDIRIVADSVIASETGLFQSMSDAEIKFSLDNNVSYKNQSRNAKPPFKLFAVNNLIVFINVLVFIVLECKGSTLDSQFMFDHGAFFLPSVLFDHEWYRAITCMFLHFGISHLFGNMAVLMFIGDNLERAVGPVKYLITYLLSGIFATVVSATVSFLLEQNALAAGASGCIFGVSGALIYILIKNKGQLEDLDVVRMVIFVAYSLFQGFTSSGVDNAAHVGGLIAGFILASLYYKKEMS